MITIVERFFFISLILLYYQDSKERKVSVWILLFAMLLGGTLHYLHQNTSVFLSSILINMLFIIIILGILCSYANLKMKKNLFEVFGMGDLLFFILLGISLPILSFLIVFICSLIFSLVIFILLKNRFKNETVPLAGLQSLFLGLTLIANKLFISFQLFTI